MSGETLVRPPEIAQASDTSSVEASFLLGDRWSPRQRVLGVACDRCLKLRQLSDPSELMCAAEVAEVASYSHTALARLSCAGIMKNGGPMPVYQTRKPVTQQPTTSPEWKTKKEFAA